MWAGAVWQYGHSFKETATGGRRATVSDSEQQLEQRGGRRKQQRRASSEQQEQEQGEGMGTGTGTCARGAVPAEVRNRSSGCRRAQGDCQRQ